MRNNIAFVYAAVVIGVCGASAGAQVIEDWSSGTDANWFRVDFLTQPPGPLPLGGTSFTVADGRYTMASNEVLPPLPVSLGAASVFLPSLAEPSFSNGVIRTTVRFNLDQTDAFIVARANLEAGEYYNLIFGAIGTGTLLNINRISEFVEATTVATATLPAVATGQDYNVEFSFLGTSLAGKVWAVGEPEPAAPQVMGTDAAYAGGGIGLGIATPVNMAGAVSLSYGAVHFIPTPASGALMVAGATMAMRRRRDRSST